MSVNSSAQTKDITESPLMEKIKDLIAFADGKVNSFEADLISQIIYTSLKMLEEGHDTGQIKLMTRAFKEMKYAYNIFNQYKTGHRISIFGSARTPEHHPDYIAAKDFSAKISAKNWVCITGAANGIMRAGLEGAQRNSSFGLSIRLPFESPSNSLMAGDPKLITFRYFFTRKLMFLSHSDAVAAFPGGVGTQDELFEVLTLMQTGKANIIPVVLLEGEGGTYWKAWNEYVEKSLLGNHLISEDDLHFYYIAPTVDAAVDHIEKFYRVYHSSRYVKELLVIRLKRKLTDKELTILNKEFPKLLESGTIYQTNAFEEETDHLELPRIAFEHNHRHFGLLRAMIDRINDF